MSSHILVVDDEPDLEVLIRQRFRKQIQANDLNFDFAGNGMEALKKIQKGSCFDIVLTDINMPEMDGLTLIGNIKDNFPLLKTVIISAYGDMKNIRTALNRGAFDFVTKPIDFTDLEHTLRRTIEEACAAREAFKHRNEVLNMQKELDVAREIQQSILPRNFPAFPARNDVDIFAKMIPAKQVGGDLYDFFFIDKDHLGFCIGDVSGKGVPAALFMAVTKTLLKSISYQVNDPGECLKKVNTILQKDSVPMVYVTLIYGILNTKTGKLKYANGGHNPFYVVSCDGDVREIGPTGGIPLGFLPDFDYQGSEFVLNNRDTLVFYTDGVTEAMDTEENEFSEKRLEQCLKTGQNNSPQPIIELVFEKVTDFTSGVEQSDDITMLAIQYNNHSE